MTDWFKIILHTCIPLEICSVVCSTRTTFQQGGIVHLKACIATQNLPRFYASEMEDWGEIVFVLSVIL